MESPQDNETMPLKDGFNFTPIFEGQRVRMRLDPRDLHMAGTKGLGFRCKVRDLDTKLSYDVYGITCSAPGCDCDARIVEYGSPKPWHRAHACRGGSDQT